MSINCTPDSFLVLIRLDQIPVIRFNFLNLGSGPELCETNPEKIKDTPIKIARAETDQLGRHHGLCVFIGRVVVGITLGSNFFQANYQFDGEFGNATQSGSLNIVSE